MTDPFTPLLGGETRRGGRKPFIRRWDAIAYGSPYQKAAALLDLAANGRGLPEGTFDVPNYEASVKLYFIFIRFDIIWTLNYFALIALHFFEQPLWCSSISEVSCRNRDYYYLGELPYLTSAESLAFKGVTLVILVVHTLFPILFEGGYFYWRNHVNKLKVISLLILSVDLVVDILHLSPVTICRIAPYIRVLFFIWNIRGLRDNLIVLGGMVVTYVNVLALWFLFLVFSSWLAYVIFEDTQQGTTFFLSYSATLYQMFVLFTTSNNPDVWIPAYKSSRWSSLFFILYVLLGVYFVTNLVLAVIYDSFKLELLKQVVAKGDMRTGTLRMVFNLIDSRGAGYLDKEQCFKLLEELNNYRTLPKISKEDFELIFNTLDHIGNDKISAEEFNDIYDAIALGFQMEDTEPWLTKFVFYNSSTSETLKNFVKSTKFGNIVAFVLLLNLATVIVETTLNIQNNSGQNFWQRVEFVFGWIYALEMALKVYTYGFENFWKDGQNQFDFIITLVIVMGETATFVSPKELTFISSGECIRYLLIARMLRLIRLLMRYQTYRTFVATFLTLIPSLMPYLGTVFWVMCIYCTLGIQIFGGIVNAGNPDLPATDLADNDYLLFNFNDYPNGMVTLFNLLVMGNWQVWMQDYATLTGTSWTYAYFISFYLITILLLLNLVVAFVLEAFFAELELEYPEEEGNQMGVRGRRNMSIRTRSQRVDMLLRQMLRSELDRSPPSSP
ncbi:putative Two pore calcium channel protein [Helianthus annuus]|uniref:Putative ion transport domain-containing protein n=1 Tax=Helianthus annuus TaxID=4232 RepID=A0A251UJG5_HELAN|nr:two pore calcium channel protein 1B isoform X1 [Helianthus annuus]KAF5803077.1 putative Two pore calcium channel protein [Helianthus annuus]KAJ0574143.1 putative Two pore calcium channel protein 1, plant [Helianthus annuus]KAJ0738477.1 putative Two pore calcium channel protein 1, plant [Helianthus annuus]KAJ0741363.1 putative Two pore calcium channel protein 1, plant [Helianthus annuus]